MSRPVDVGGDRYSRRGPRLAPQRFDDDQMLEDDAGRDSATFPVVDTLAESLGVRDTEQAGEFAIAAGRFNDGCGFCRGHGAENKLSTDS